MIHPLSQDFTDRIGIEAVTSAPVLCLFLDLRLNKHLFWRGSLVVQGQRPKFDLPG